MVNLLLASAHLPTIFITILEAVYKEMSLAPGPLANGLTQREMGGQEGRALGAVVRGALPATSLWVGCLILQKPPLLHPAAPFGFWFCIVCVLRDHRTSRGKCGTGNAQSECNQEPGGWCVCIWGLLCETRGLEVGAGKANLGLNPIVTTY